MFVCFGSILDKQVQAINWAIRTSARNCSVKCGNGTTRLTMSCHSTTIDLTAIQMALNFPNNNYMLSNRGPAVMYGSFRTWGTASYSMGQVLPHPAPVTVFIFMEMQFCGPLRILNMSLWESGDCQVKQQQQATAKLSHHKLNLTFEICSR